MFGHLGQQQFDSNRPVATCKLWTFTFPEEEVRLNPALCAARWKRLNNDRRFRGRKFVHVLESSKRGYWHYHCVTPERWDVDEMRLIAEQHGFGRINVKELPVSKSEYVAKYLQKKPKALPAGMRRWACHGFKGTKVSSIRITSDLIIRDTPDDNNRAYSRLIVTLPDGETITYRLRLTTNAEYDNHMKITETASKEILKMACGGQAPMVGEYRGFEVRQIAITDDENPAHVEIKHIVEYGVEFPIANGQVKSIKCGMWLEKGTPPETVKAPANKGDPVVVAITGMSLKWGNTISSIRPLATLV